MEGILRFTTTTVDELDGVEVKFVNVYLRDDKPGGLSVLLILPDSELVLAPGDDFSIGERSYRITSIEPGKSGFYEIEVDAETRSSADKDLSVDNGPVQVELPEGTGSADLVRALKSIGQTIIDGLIDEGAAPPQLMGWEQSQSESISKDWTGEEWGPSRHFLYSGQFDDADMARFGRLEVRVSHDDIRYNRNEPYRYEVSGWWCVNKRSAHIFARQDVPDDLSHFYGAEEDWVNDLIVQAIDAQKRGHLLAFAVNVDDLVLALQVMSQRVLRELASGEVPEIFGWDTKHYRSEQRDWKGLSEGVSVEQVDQAQFLREDKVQHELLEARVNHIRRERKDGSPVRHELRAVWRFGEHSLRMNVNRFEGDRAVEIQVSPDDERLRNLILREIAVVCGTSTD